MMPFIPYNFEMIM